MRYHMKVESLLAAHARVDQDPSREALIRLVSEQKEAFVAGHGALVVTTPVDSTGRSPKDTYIVRRPEIANKVDWDSPNNQPMEPELFDQIFEDALALLGQKGRLVVTRRAIGADPEYHLPVTLVTDHALSALFADNMFRPLPAASSLNTVFAEKPFLLLALPQDRLNQETYLGKLRITPEGTCADLVVVMDFSHRVGVVLGSSYLGSIKKLMFTVMNYLLPGAGVLPLHASANEGEKGDIALFLGLSGTGKTTLSADPNRRLLGDDEHGWSDKGIWNFENGCYAKLIGLSRDKEPEIYDAVMHTAPVEQHGAILENVMCYPQGHVDLYDDRLTENTRGSYPLTFLKNIKVSSRGGHPQKILFLTADANGVLPPVARLTEPQAMLWFLMGYTSKLAGTETGVVSPQSTFSRFFGGPFMPRNPDVYAGMLGEKIRQKQTEVFLINTGWCGGPYGAWPRISLSITRSIVHTLLDGDLHTLTYREDPLFHIMVPESFPGVPQNQLHPRQAWKDLGAYEERAQKLAREFSAYFDKTYGNKNLDPAIVASCPGK